MADTLPAAQDCCLDCAESIIIAIPGPQGEACEPCNDGVAGINAFSLIDGSVVVAVPAWGAAATITLIDPPGNQWMGVGQLIYISPYGYYQVTGLTGTDQATILNLGSATFYASNVNNGMNFAGNSKVSPGGLQGPAGATGVAAAQQVFYGTGVPAGVQVGQDPILPAIYLDFNPGGLLYWWNPGTGGWF